MHKLTLTNYVLSHYFVKNATLISKFLPFATNYLNVLQHFMVFNLNQPLEKQVFLRG